MRVALDITCLSEPMTGVALYTRQLAKALRRINHPAFRWLYFHDDPRKLYLLDPGITPGEALNKNFARRSNLFDIFHSTNYIIPSTLLKSRIPCLHIVTIYDLSFFLFPHFFTKEALKYFKTFQASLARADRIITISQAGKKDILRHFDVHPDRLRVVYPGLDHATFHPPSEKQAFEPSGLIAEVNRQGMTSYSDFEKTRYFLFVGTREPRKNIRCVIEAFTLLTPRYPDLKLVLVGQKGWLHTEIDRKIAKLQSSGKIVELGYVEEKILPLLYSKAVAFIYPSLYEGFGMPPLEAMACGCPVITSDRSSLPEAVGGAGLCVNPLSPYEISAAMSKILENPHQRKKMSDEGLEHARNFSWEKAAKETVEIYLQTAKEKNPCASAVEK